MSIECATCDGTGAHDYTGFTCEIETETCRGCDGTGLRGCDACNNRATREVRYPSRHGSDVMNVDYWCDKCASLPVF